MIVPLALTSTLRMKGVQDLLESHASTWYSNFAWRPGKLFDTVNRALTIFISICGTDRATYSTNYQKWTSDNRAGLLERIAYVLVDPGRTEFWVPKLGYAIEKGILRKMLAAEPAVRQYVEANVHRIYYRTTGGLYWKVFTPFAPMFKLDGKIGHSSRETSFGVRDKSTVNPLIGALSSNTFWWWYTVTSNLRDLNPYDVYNFRVPESALQDPKVVRASIKYSKDIDHNSTMLVRLQKQTGRTETQSFRIQLSKPIIDEIDHALAVHYGFTDEELDFIINYDIKYRMGRDEEED